MMRWRLISPDELNLQKSLNFLVSLALLKSCPVAQPQQALHDVRRNAMRQPP